MQSSNEGLQKFSIHILLMRKPKVDFSVFHFMLDYSSPNECRGLCQHSPENSSGAKIKLHEMKNRKSNFGFSYI